MKKQSKRQTCKHGECLVLREIRGLRKDLNEFIALDKAKAEVRAEVWHTSCPFDRPEGCHAQECHYLSRECKCKDKEGKVKYVDMKKVMKEVKRERDY